MADELLKIKDSFRNELKSGVITLEVVCDKVKKSNELLGMSPDDYMISSTSSKVSQQGERLLKVKGYSW